MSKQDQPLPKMMSMFSKLRLDEDSTDAVLKVQDVEFGVHKARLSCIPYFEYLFSRWSPPEQRVYEVSFTSAETMQLIIDYIYTGSLVLTESNVQELLEVVNYINYVELIEACSNFLTTRRSSEGLPAHQRNDRETPMVFD